MNSTVNLNDILKGMRGLSYFKAGMLLESCVVTLQRQNHRSGNKISISGDHNDFLQLDWSLEVDEQVESTYMDQQEATEHAAECIAILLSKKLSGYTVIERSVKSTGIDYWLGNDDSFLFQKTARLEMSGIFDGNERVVERRFNQKCKQTTASDESKLPVIVSVTSFKQPHSKYEKRI